ncbi:hypothetical protein [Catellatospora methionotrophica]|uniref:hypothetical protein n=1 Tax=Catellatospora methionotrophica TaxID=121620 RepID=UPI0033D38E38
MRDAGERGRELDLAADRHVPPLPLPDPAELRARADRRYPISTRVSKLIDIIRRRPAGRWITASAGAMSVLVTLGAVQLFGPGAPTVATSPPPCVTQTCALPLVIEILAERARGGDARTSLRALASIARNSADVGRDGPATYVHVQEYTVDPANRTAPGEAHDDKLLWYPDGPARQTERSIQLPAQAFYDPIAALVDAGPERTVNLETGQLGLPEVKLSDSFQLLAASVNDQVPDGGSPATRAFAAVAVIVDLYRHHALTPAQSHAVLMMLSDLPLQAYGEIVARDGSRGLAYGIDDDAGRQRSILVFDPATGYLKGHEQIWLPAADEAGGSPVVMSFLVVIEAAQRQ